MTLGADFGGSVANSLRMVAGSSRPTPVSASSPKAKRRIGCGAMRGAMRAPQYAASSTGNVQYRVISIIGQCSSPRAICQVMRTTVLIRKMVIRVERIADSVHGCR